MRIFWTLFALACGAGPKGGASGEEGAAKDPFFPFPSMHYMADGRVSIPTDLPYSTDGTPVDGERLAWRTGFSVAQSTV